MSSFSLFPFSIPIEIKSSRQLNCHLVLCMCVSTCKLPQLFSFRVFTKLIMKHTLETDDADSRINASKQKPVCKCRLNYCLDIHWDCRASMAYSMRKWWNIYSCLNLHWHAFCFLSRRCIDFAKSQKCNTCKYRPTNQSYCRTNTSVRLCVCFVRVHHNSWRDWPIVLKFNMLYYFLMTCTGSFFIISSPQIVKVRHTNPFLY